jgi:hypothetical protein
VKEQDFDASGKPMKKEPTGNAEAEPQVGATTDLPHDRITVQRFSQVFSTHTLERQLNAWFVPGQTAERRIERWLAEMEAEADAFADERAGTLSHSIRSKAAISKPRLLPCKSGRLTLPLL